VSDFDLTYVTIDSVSEGVGSSQIIPLMQRLSQNGLKVQLISYEKTHPESSFEQTLEVLGVDWKPLRFQIDHKFSVIHRISQLARSISNTKLIHARSDMPAVSAVLSKEGPILWDIRSLWSDQRSFIESNPLKKKLAELSRGFEWLASKNSSAISTLTHQVVPLLEDRYPNLPKLRIVVPTVVDLDRFRLSKKMPSKVLGLYSGTFNPYYDLDLSKKFTGYLNLIVPTEVHWAKPKESPQEYLGVGESHVFESTQQSMASILKDYSFGLSVCRLDAGSSLKAAMPTKIAEFLATGRPVVVNKGLGDFDEYLTEFNAGVILDGSESNLRNMAHNLAEILADPETPMRCRALAEKYFDVDSGAQKYLDLYPKILRETQ
jgi:hypothetical protein